MSELSYDRLRDAVSSEGVAFRVRARLQPAGGEGTPVYPPTYSDTATGTKYAVEGALPREDGRTDRPTDRWERVVLDSVASQANRLEEALEEAWELGDLAFPVAYVDFSTIEDLADLDRITVLEAPHRIADAIFRDSLLEDTLFRLSDVGQAITEARPGSAAAMLKYCPTALVFGQWDSTGPKGGLGAKFQRSLVSEIVGHDVRLGVKVGSRIDPLQIGSGIKIYEAEDAGEEWTLDPGQARIKGKKPVEFDRSGSAGVKGRPSMINHGNVTPSIVRDAGGVVISHATQTLVLSLASLRKLRFPVNAEGMAIDRSVRREAETAARTALAALGLAAAAHQVDRDHDLRSRCLLVNTERPVLELLGRAGEAPEMFALNAEAIDGIVAESAQSASDHGLGWAEEPLVLTPAPKLADLIRASRAAAIEEGAEE